MILWGIGEQVKPVVAQLAADPAKDPHKGENSGSGPNVSNMRSLGSVRSSPVPRQTGAAPDADIWPRSPASTHAGDS